MSNIYHILFEDPPLEKEDMYIELEHLAQALTEEGLIRIDAGYNSNFVRFTLPHIDFTFIFSQRELTDSRLIDRTKKFIAKGLTLGSRKGEPDLELVDQIFNIMKKELSKNVPVSFELEMKIARTIVQMCHPVVILMAIVEHIEIFYSYSWNIGDVMDVVSWQQAGANSGMQSLSEYRIAVFVSCGGDPYTIEEKRQQLSGPPEEEPIYGSGFPALARAIIIGGQEFGHYADLKRNAGPFYYSRHSTNIYQSAASIPVRRGRIHDMKNISDWCKKFASTNLNTMLELERQLKFFHKNKFKNTGLLWCRIKYFFSKKIFKSKLDKIGFELWGDYKKFKYPATYIKMMLDDMAFNLAPDADVYKNPNKTIEEMIMCIESLARVPQQANKWGHKSANLMYPNLYNIYYNEVIPSLIREYETITGLKFHLYPTTLTKVFILKKILVKTWKKIKKKIFKS